MINKQSYGWKWAVKTRAYFVGKYSMRLTSKDLYQMAVDTDRCAKCNKELSYRRDAEFINNLSRAVLNRIGNEYFVDETNANIICLECSRAKDYTPYKNVKRTIIKGD